MTTRELITAYFDAFNRHDAEALLSILSDDVVHEINEGPTEVGIERFRAFKAHMDEAYREQIKDMVIMVEGDRGCCDFICEGTYMKTDAGLPEAKNQTYVIPGCAIFTCQNGKITKIASYYNLKNWISAIS
jgi:steroid delta-isomerase-like uncharacterized protein